MNYFDLHCDTLSALYENIQNKNKEDIYNNSLHISLQKATVISNYCQVFAVWTKDNISPFDAYEHFKKVYKYFQRQLIKYDAKISFCKDGKDIQNAIAEGKMVALLSIEGARVIIGSLELLREFYDLGVRIMTLTWNGRNCIGDGVGVKEAGGLTPFGKMVVGEMERLGMIVDVSHISEKGFWDVAEIAKRPFIATHSNSQSICSNSRNLNDEQFITIQKRGGLVGLNFCSAFIDDNRDSASIKVLIKHIEHFMSLGGQKTLCMGSDFDGARPPTDLDSLDKVGAIYDALLRMNYPQELVEGIMYENAMNFMLKCL